MPLLVLIERHRLMSSSLTTILQDLSVQGFHHTLLFLDDIPSRQQLAERLAEAKDTAYDRALVCGGDGTLHQVVEALVLLPRDRRLPLAAIPMGTANDFAISAGVGGATLGETFLRTAKAAVRNVDVAWVNDHPFINVASGGCVTKATSDIAQPLKGLFGRFAYYLNALAKATEISSSFMRFRGDSWKVEEECVAFAVGNASSAGGGLKVAPAAKINDGVLDLLVVPAQSFLELAALGTELLQDEPRLELHHVHYIQASKFTLETPSKIQINLDGEPVSGTCFQFRVEPMGLRMAVEGDLLR
ncbi:MAG: diacylglycerol kinase family protein [Bdellovibrionales bacterium]